MFKALKSFSGILSATVGDVLDIANPDIAKDLIKAGYIEEIKPEKKPEKKKTKKD